VIESKLQELVVGEDAGSVTKARRKVGDLVVKHISGNVVILVA
jgi:hypothetical protein